MTKITKALMLALFVFVCGANVAKAQGNFRVRVQMIHASVDPALQNLDVILWANTPFGQANLDTVSNFSFLSTDGFLNRVVPIPFGSVPASFDVKISLCPAGGGISNALKTFDLTIFENDTAVALAYGKLDNSLANPADAVQLAYLRFAKETASAGNVRVNVFHAGFDAPTVDVVANGSAPFVNNLAYGNEAGYSGEVPALDYTLQVRGAGSPTDVARYLADLTALGGQSFIIFAAGYLDPTQHDNGAQFGLYAVLPDGTVIKLPTYTAMGVQAVHSSADPAAALVDLYINGETKIDDVPYLGATPFLKLDLPLVANNKVYVGVAPSNSASVNDTIANFVFNVNDGDSLYLVANGLLSQTGFDVSVNGSATNFNIFPIAGATTVSGGTGVKIRPFHGITDAPAVEISAVAGAFPITSGPIAYGEAQAYTAEAPASAGIDVRVTAGGSDVANYTADLTGLDGQNILVIASGFLSSVNNSRRGFGGLYAVLPSGTVVALPSSNKARIQLIHNSADANLGLVDVYLLGTKVDDVSFGEATPFIDFTLPYANTTVPVGFAAPNSTSVNQSIAFLNAALAAGDTSYVVVAGVSQPNNYDTSVNGPSIALGLQKIDARATVGSTEVLVKVFHGTTDAPAVDVYADATKIVNNAPYLASTPFIGPLPVANYTITVTPTGNFAAAVDSFVADLPALNAGGNAILVLATGFLDKSKNPQGSPAGKTFALNAVLPSGINVFLPKKTPATAVNSNFVQQFSVYPNPTSETLNVSLRGLVPGELNISIVDVNGREVMSNTSQVSADANVSLNVANLPTGLYIVRAQQGSLLRTAQVVVVR